MALYKLTENALSAVEQTTFQRVNVHERADLQRLLCDQIEVVAPGCLLIAEEFGDWHDSRRRIDLLAIDQDANLVVIELKRTEDGGHMELQAVRYAAMVSTITFEQAARAFETYLASKGRDPKEAASLILDHLGWDEPDEDAFGQDVRIVLASAQFSRELSTTMLWLNERGLEIRCVRMIPYATDEGVFVDIQHVIPLPEAEEYQVRVREKTQMERVARKSNRDYTKYMITLDGTTIGPLAKRETVLRIVRHLCDRGVSPEDIRGVVSRRKNNSFCSAPGSFASEDEFIEAVREIQSRNGRRFAPHRWYTADEFRIESNDMTYAVANQWGGRAIEWLEEVLTAFPGHGVVIEAAPK